MAEAVTRVLPSAPSGPAADQNLFFYRAIVGGAQRRLWPRGASMINGVFIINNQGKPRLAKFYEYLVRARRRPRSARP